MSAGWVIRCFIIRRILWGRVNATTLIMLLISRADCLSNVPKEEITFDHILATIAWFID